MQLKDMKVKVSSPIEAIQPSKTSYPYGLEVRLEKEALDKLGMEIGDFAIGATGTLAGGYRVISLSESKSDPSTIKCVTLQIEKLGIKEPNGNGTSIDDAVSDSKEELKVKRTPKKKK